MRDLIFQVSLGKPSRLYQLSQATIANYAKEVGADYHLLTEPILRIAPDPRRSGRSREATEKYGGYLPIFEKANAYDLLRASNGEGYDRIAIIDSDVWARPGAPNIFEELGSADFAGVRERDQPSNEKHLRKLPRFSKNMFGPLSDVSWDWDQRGCADFHNLGVMVIGNGFKDRMEGQSAREFLRRPEFQKFINGEGFLRYSTEQTLMNWWMRKSGVRMKNLSWKWNALYSAIPNERVREAHFVHFFLRDKLPSKGENVEALERIISAD